MGYILLAISVGFELLGTTFLKYSEGYTKLMPSLISIISYVICFYSFSKALHTVNLSIAYATWSAVGLIVTGLISVFLFKEALTPIGVFALIMITVGVVILNMYGAPVK